MQHDSVRRVYRAEKKKKWEKKITQIKRKKRINTVYTTDPACSGPCAKILEKYFKSDWVSFTCVFCSNVIAELFIVREPIYAYTYTIFAEIRDEYVEFQNKYQLLQYIYMRELHGSGIKFIYQFHSRAKEKCVLLTINILYYIIYVYIYS